MAEHDDLILRWELGVADAADQAALSELLRDPAVRRAFVRHARVAAALASAQPAAAVLSPSARSVVTRPRRMRRARRAPPLRWALAAGILLLVGVAFAALRHAPPAPAPLIVRDAAPTPAYARLERGEDVAVVARDGQRRRAGVGAALAAGETVEATSPAVVVLGTAVARLELAAGTRLGLPDAGGDPARVPVRLALGAGRVRAEVAPRPPGASLQIATALANAEVVGTRFTFSAEAQGARLAVEDGSVRLAAPGEAGVLVGAGRAGLVADGLASLACPAAEADQPLPAGSRVLWRYAPPEAARDTAGWRGVVEPATAADATPVWRAVPAQAGDPWCRGEVRSPVVRDGWAVEPGTWLRFRYHLERAGPGLSLVMHLKPADESNFAQRLRAEDGDGWHQALLRVDDAFHHVERGQVALAAGERIHGAVFCIMRDAGDDLAPVRFWVRDAVVFAVP